MQFGRFHGIALAVLGVILLGIQAMLYMTPKKVVAGATESSTPKVEHKKVISYMPQQNYAAAEIEHPEKVLSVSFVTDNQPTKVL